MILHDSRRSAPGDRDGERTWPPAGDSRSGRLPADPAARLVEEFAAAWERGERPPAEAFFERHPLLAVQPEAAIRVIYEEVCLRQSEGESVPVTELVRRFPQWRSELEVLLDCDRLLGAGPGPPALPGVGELLGDFLLTAELGRGARGRCFLAAQPSLSYRQVVLKVTPDDHVEHLSLARLQHTHIMPLYSEHEFPARRLRALCMPYLGGATLARILAELGDLPPGRRSGRSLLDVLDRSQRACPWPQAREGPARQFLARTSYVRAVCWIGACLADALQYAHDRGLVHMDIKPSNILLTADGQPMLLDFHLATAPIPSGESPAGGIGGTPGYMSPEQEALVAAMDTGWSIVSGVDARSDLYSLGRVLAEMLGATIPAMGDAARSPRSWRFPPEVSTGLADIVRKCLAIEPAGRYPDAAALAEDLRRHMADLPLRGVRNRSPAERWRKWCRRQPYELFRMKALAAASGTAAIVAGLVWLSFVAPRLRGATDALREGRVLLDRQDYPQAARVLTRGAALIEGIPGGARLSRDLAASLRLTDRLGDVDRLHRLVDRLRVAESAAERAGPSARDVVRHCLALWEARRSLLEHPGVSLDPAIEQQLRDDLLDLAVIGSNLRVALESDARRAEAHRAGLRLLDEAEALFGPSHVLYLARQAHAGALGLSDLAAAAARGAARVPPRSAWEHDAAGRVLLAAGDLARAGAAFERALALRPQDLWPNFHQGVCDFRLGRYQEAVNAFRVCVALAPDRAECYYNRALAYAALGRPAEAARDYDCAVALDPTLAAVPFERSAPRRTGPPPLSTSRQARGPS